jgi:sugar-specific transcriptional regulator TrmB
MDEQLQQLGLSAKEARVYLLLLEKPQQSAAGIAKELGEKRANTYMLLEQLAELHLVEVDETKPVRAYSAANPTALQKMLQRRLEREQHAAATLQKALPSLRSMYALASDKPGVVHMAGYDGFKAILDDQIRSSTDILLIASNDVPNKPEELVAFRKLLVARKNAGVRTRAIFHSGDRNDEFRRLFEERGIELRFLGEQPFRGEVALYEDNVVFTVYEPSLVSTVITNALIAETMRTLFEQLWNGAH